VPDGDTGTNLTLTMRAIDEAVQSSTASDRATIAKEISRAALRGARGNSGVILSQIVRGAADVLAESDNLAKAFRSASDDAYRAVRRPVEGTMLTAIRELAEEAEANRDLPPGELLPKLVARGEDTVSRTTEMLDVLKEAGVVDSGAAGLVEIVRGISAAWNGEELPAAPQEHDDPGVEAMHQELSQYRYCTVFLVEGENLDAEALEDELDRLGDSLLVVGDPSALKVHVHTDDPGQALSLAVAQGAISGVEIANMHEQTAQRQERLLAAVPQAPAAPANASQAGLTDAIVVTVGRGNRALFESLGARAIDGGRTMNPSTAEILEAIEASPAAEAVVLPNNKNVVMSAEQAAEHASKPVRVLPTVSLQAGLAAMVSFDPAKSAEENAAEMGEILGEVATGAVTVASRDVQLNGLEIRKGSFLGLVDGEAVAGGDGFDEVAGAVVERLLAQPRGVLTLLTGDDAPVLNGVVSRVESEHPEVELEVHDGGQPHYPLLLSAE
jgi:DAK2 domain fusion protein YloV